MAWNEKDEVDAALAVTPLMREIVDYVRAKLPDRTHFAVLVEVYLAHTGDWSAAGTAQARRWARLPARKWQKTIALDGWEPERGS